MDESLGSKFSKRLELYFKTPGALSKSEVARRIGREPQYVHAIEKQKHYGNEFTRRAIAKVVGIPYEEMIGEERQKEELKHNGGMVDTHESAILALVKEAKNPATIKEILQMINWLEIAKKAAVSERVKSYLRGIVDGLAIHNGNGNGNGNGHGGSPENYEKP